MAWCRSGDKPLSVLVYWHIYVTRPQWVNRATHWTFTLGRRYNDSDGVSNHKPYDCLLNRFFFRHRWKKTSKLRVTVLCEGKSPDTVNSPNKGPVTSKMLPFDDVIMILNFFASSRLPFAHAIAAVIIVVAWGKCHRCPLATMLQHDIIILYFVRYNKWQIETWLIGHKESMIVSARIRCNPQIIYTARAFLRSLCLLTGQFCRISLRVGYLTCTEALKQ